MGLPKEVNYNRKYKTGKQNLMTDVPGITVGHKTLVDKERYIYTGVTAILPHEGNLFRDKVMAASYVINGFGKSVGLIQIEELGTIETPILMTNTFSVPTASNALIRYMLQQNEEIGATTGTVNCLVTECNDGSLNDIRGFHVTEEDVLYALEHGKKDFEEGAVGAGTGMVCMGLKGGIGSASREISVDEKTYHLGAMVLSNFGVAGNLRFNGRRIVMPEVPENPREQGSCIILIATDLPFHERQLKRIAKRATVGLSRVGSFLGNGSGDISIAFTTANRVPHKSAKKILSMQMFHDDAMDEIFEITAETVEESVLSSLYHAVPVKGKYKEVWSLRQVLFKEEQ